MESTGSVLADLVGDPRPFADRYWGRQPLLRPHCQRAWAQAVDSSDGPDGLAGLLPIEAVDRWLSSAPRRPTVRLVSEGANLEPARYCRPTRLGPETFTDVVDGAKVADAFRAGATVVLQSMHRTWPSISTMAAALEAEISHPVQVNAYLTPPFSVGLGSHRDGHDVFVVQTYGTKTWTVDGLGSFVLQPGDMLYLPAQTMHQAVATDEPSLHLTIGVLRLTLAAVLRRVIDECEALAQPLSLGFAAQPDSDLAGMISAAVATAVDALHQADPEALARRVIANRHPRRHHQGRLLAAIAVTQLDQSSRLRWRQPELAHLETLAVAESDGDGNGDSDGHGDGRNGDGMSDMLLLHFADGRLRLPPSTRCALERLMTGVDCTVGQLPGLDPTSRVVLARRLIEENALTLLPD